MTHNSGIQIHCSSGPAMDRIYYEIGHDEQLKALISGNDIVRHNGIETVDHPQLENTISLFLKEGTDPFELVQKLEPLIENIQTICSIHAGNHPYFDASRVDEYASAPLDQHDLRALLQADKTDIQSASFEQLERLQKFRENAGYTAHGHNTLKWQKTKEEPSTQRLPG